MTTTLRPFAHYTVFTAAAIACGLAVRVLCCAIDALIHFYRYGNPFEASLVAAWTYVSYYSLFICDASAFTDHVVRMCMLLGLVLPSPLLPATIVTSARLPKPRVYIRPETHCRDLVGELGIRECSSGNVRRFSEERTPSLVRPASIECKLPGPFVGRKATLPRIRFLPHRPSRPASALRPWMSKSTDSSTCRPAVGDSTADQCLVTQMEVDEGHPCIVRNWEMEKLTEQFAAMHIVHSTRDGSPSPDSQQLFPLLPMDEDLATGPPVVSGDSAAGHNMHTSTTVPSEPLAWSLLDSVNAQSVADRGAGLRESSLNDGYTALSAAEQTVAGVQRVVGDSAAALNEEISNASASSVCDAWMDIDSSEEMISSTTSDADVEVSVDSSSDSDAGLPDGGDASSEQQQVDGGDSSEAFSMVVDDSNVTTPYNEPPSSSSSASSPPSSSASDAGSPEPPSRVLVREESSGDEEDKGENGLRK